MIQWTNQTSSTCGIIRAGLGSLKEKCLLSCYCYIIVPSRRSNSTHWLCHPPSKNNPASSYKSISKIWNTKLMPVINFSRKTWKQVLSTAWQHMWPSLLLSICPTNIKTKQIPFPGWEKKGKMDIGLCLWWENKLPLQSGRIEQVFPLISILCYR